MLTEVLKQKRVDDQLNNAFKAADILARQNRDANSLEDIVKAMDTAESGGGSEWIPTGFSPNVINQVRQELIVSSLFQNIYMPTPSYKMPVESNPAQAYIVPENTADTSQTSITPSQFSTGQVTFNAHTLGAMTRVSFELDQDSIVPMVPMIQRNLLRGHAQGLEDAIINGDTTGTHQDSDVTSATDPRKGGWKGLRKYAIANSLTVDGATFNSTALRTARSKMGKYGINPTNLVWIVSNAVYCQMLGFPEVLTLEKFGPHATILTGQLAAIDGIPVVVSPYLRQDMNASGVYDGTTTTKTAAILVNKDAFLVGDRQQVVLSEDDTPREYRQRKLIADRRIDFQPAFNLANEKALCYVYNITA
jgi:hypothetical protein